MLDFISPDPVALHARLRPGTLAAVDLESGRRWSYRALDADIQRAVQVLTAQGVTRGDRVAALARNSVHQVILQQALMRIGAIFVPLNWRLSLPELARLVQDCAPRLIYADQDLPDLPEGCRPGTMRDFARAVDVAELAPPCPPHSGMDCCIILYTSGTSGTPKGAMLTSQFLLATAVNFNVLGEVDTGAVFLCDSPMFHVIGIVTQIWPPLLRGGKILVSPGFDPERTNDRLGDPDFGVRPFFLAENIPGSGQRPRTAATPDPPLCPLARYPRGPPKAGIGDRSKSRLRTHAPARWLSAPFPAQKAAPPPLRRNVADGGGVRRGQCLSFLPNNAEGMT